MKIWWCEEHKCSGGEICVTADWEDSEYGSPVPCRMVEMELVPVVHQPEMTEPLFDIDIPDFVNRHGTW